MHFDACWLLCDTCKWFFAFVVCILFYRLVFFCIFHSISVVYSFFVIVVVLMNSYVNVLFIRTICSSFFEYCMCVCGSTKKQTPADAIVPWNIHWFYSILSHSLFRAIFFFLPLVFLSFFRVNLLYIFYYDSSYRLSGWLWNGKVDFFMRSETWIFTFIGARERDKGRGRVREKARNWRCFFLFSSAHTSFSIHR